jgi:hypothetical protein
MPTDTFFHFRNQFRTFLWYLFRTGGDNDCDQMYEINPDVGMTPTQILV